MRAHIASRLTTKGNTDVLPCTMIVKTTVKGEALEKANNFRFERHDFLAAFAGS